MGARVGSQLRRMPRAKSCDVTGRGGVYTGDSPAKVLDFQEPYLRGILGFLGLDDVTFIHVEGLKVSTEAAQQGAARAREQIAALAGLPQLTAA